MLFFVKSNEKCVNNEKPKGICFFILIVDDFWELLWQVLIFSSKGSKSAEIMNGTFIDLSPWLYFNTLLSLHFYITMIMIFTCITMLFKFILCTKWMKTVQTIKVPILFSCYPLRNADKFFRKIMPSFSIY